MLSTPATSRSILALLVAMAAFAAAATGCGGGDDTPASILSEASLEGVESGKVDLSLHIAAAGKEGNELDVRLSGPFRRTADLPQVALKATVKGKADGEAIDFAAGLVLLSDHGFLNYKGTEYEIDPENFGLARPTFLPLAPGQGKDGTVSALNACLEAAGGLDLGSFGDNLSDGGSADVDGTSTTRISGDLDVPAALDALVELAEDPSCSAQLAAAGRSAGELAGLQSELAGAVKKAHIEIYVGDDDIIRKVAGELVAEPKSAGRGQVEIDFELTLSQVNEDPKIEAPAGGKPILAWLEGLGIDPFDALFLIGEKDGLGSVLEAAAADAFPALQGQLSPRP